MRVVLLLCICPDWCRSRLSAINLDLCLSDVRRATCTRPNGRRPRRAGASADAAAAAEALRRSHGDAPASGVGRDAHRERDGSDVSGGSGTGGASRELSAQQDAAARRGLCAQGAHGARVPGHKPPESVPVAVAPLPLPE